MNPSYSDGSGAHVACQDGAFGSDGSYGGQDLLDRVVVSSGHLLYHRESALMAHSFDPTTLGLTGELRQIAEGLFFNPLYAVAAYAVSNTGTLVYRTGVGFEQANLTWYDRTGKLLETVGSPAVYRGVSLSPNDRRIAVHLHQEPEGGDIWVVDRDRGSFTRVTFADHNSVPLWSPDSASLLFSSARGPEQVRLYKKPASGLGDPELLLDVEGRVFVEDWAPDGQSILFGQVTDPITGVDIWMLPTSGTNRTPRPLVKTKFNDQLAKFSPDGRWIAYESNESGGLEVYVQSYPPGTGKWQISVDGGRYVRWARNGKELFYLKNDGSVMAVDVAASGSAFKAAKPRLLFRVNPVLQDHTRGGMLDIPYDVTNDDQRFLFTERLTRGTPQVPHSRAQLVGDARSLSPSEATSRERKRMERATKNDEG